MLSLLQLLLSYWQYGNCKTLGGLDPGRKSCAACSVCLANHTQGGPLYLQVRAFHAAVSNLRIALPCSSENESLDVSAGVPVVRVGRDQPGGVLLELPHVAEAGPGGRQEGGGDASAAEEGGGAAPQGPALQAIPDSAGGWNHFSTLPCSPLLAGCQFDWP